MPTLYRKTEKGSAEIATRINRLVPRLRGALILVDGRRSDIELCRMIPGQGDELLLTLLEAGYIEMVGVVVPMRAATLPTLADAA
jgi:hypothetical protein